MRCWPRWRRSVRADGGGMVVAGDYGMNDVSLPVFPQRGTGRQAACLPPNRMPTASLAG